MRIPKNFLLPTCFIVPKKKKRERKRDEVLFVWVKKDKIRVEEKNWGIWYPRYQTHNESVMISLSLSEWCVFWWKEDFSSSSTKTNGINWFWLPKFCIKEQKKRCSFAFQKANFPNFSKTKSFWSPKRYRCLFSLMQGSYANETQITWCISDLGRMNKKWRIIELLCASRKIESKWRKICRFTYVRIYNIKSWCILIVFLYPLLDFNI